MKQHGYKRVSLLVVVFFVSSLYGSEDLFATLKLPRPRGRHRRTHTAPEFSTINLQDLLSSSPSSPDGETKTSSDYLQSIRPQVVDPYASIRTSSHEPFDPNNPYEPLRYKMDPFNPSNPRSPFYRRTSTSPLDPYELTRTHLHEPFNPSNPFAPLSPMFQSTGFGDEDLHGSRRSRRRHGSFSFDYANQDEPVPSRVLILNEGKIPHDLTLFQAIESGTEEQVHLLLVETNLDINQVDKKGKAVLHCATEKTLELVQAKQQKPEGRGLLSRVLPLGQSLDQINLEERKMLKLVRLLVRHNADINKADSNGKTVLHKAAQAGHLSLIKLFLKSSAVDSNQVDSQGKSALHFAAAQDHREIIKRLIKAGAQDIVDKEGLSCLEVAKDHATGQFMTQLWKKQHEQEDQSKKDDLEDKEHKDDSPVESVLDKRPVHQRVNQKLQFKIVELKRKLEETQFELRSALYREKIYTEQTKKDSERLRQYEDSIQSAVQATHSIQEAIGQTRQTVVDYQHQSAKDLADAKVQVEHRVVRFIQHLQQQRKDSRDKKNSVLQVLEEQLRNARQDVERLTQVLQEQQTSTQVKEEELKETQQRLEDAQQEVTRLTALLHQSRQEGGSVSPSVVHHHTVHQTHVQGDLHQDQYGGQVVQGDVGLLRGDESRQCCNHWICKALCCFKCCRRCQDSCKDMKFKWGLNPC